MIHMYQTLKDHMKTNTKQFVDEVLFLIGLAAFVWMTFYIASVW
jgi:hypothetical protein